MTIEPRKKWPDSSFMGKCKIDLVNETGICISKYGDPGYGSLVRKGKYSTPPCFGQELVVKSASVLKHLIEKENIAAITCVPSQRNTLVLNFTQRLAAECGLKFIPLLTKNGTVQQKSNNNSTFQCRNAFESFSVVENADIPESIILADDIVDSCWTLTVCGYKLKEKGCLKVIPFALADSSQNREEQ